VFPKTGLPPYNKEEPSLYARLFRPMELLLSNKVKLWTALSRTTSELYLPIVLVIILVYY
jgi:hypothetical protein